jgi:hypothetical protein
MSKQKLPSIEPLALSKSDAPAFPTFDHPWMGLTKREYFAAKALQGMLSQWVHPEFSLTPEDWAKSAAQLGDALLAELNKENHK